MNPRFPVYGLLVLLLFGCQTVPPKKTVKPVPVVTSARSADDMLPRIWLHTDSEVPEMKIVLLPDGSFKFIGGYAFWSPGRWSFNSDTFILTLTLPKMRKSDFKDMLQQQERDRIIKIDPTAKKILYAIDPLEPSIVFQGFYFLPESPLPK